jgi:hypothetical protein
MDPPRNGKRTVAGIREGPVARRRSCYEQRQEGRQKRREKSREKMRRSSQVIGIWRGLMNTRLRATAA